MSMLSFIFSILVSNSFALVPDVGMITAVSGTTELLTLEKDSGTTQPKVIFEGKKYILAKAKVGVKLKEGDLLRTGTDGKIKVIFLNGDVLVVSPSTAVTIPSKKEKAQLRPQSELVYGMMRAVIDPSGPRSQMEVKTTSAVAGVRGTDFCVGYNPSRELTEVTVLRGQAIVKPEGLLSEKKIELKTGERTEVGSEAKKSQEVVTSTRENLVNIQDQTTMIVALPSDLHENEKVQIAALETQAVKNVIVDIERYQPELAKELAIKKPETSDQVNSHVILDLYKAVPGEVLSSDKAVSAKAKPKSKELEGLNEDVYKKYFERFVK